MKDHDTIKDMRDDETQILPVIEDSKRLRNPILSVFMNVCSRELKKFLFQWRVSSDVERCRMINRERKYLAELKEDDGIEIETKVKTGVYIKVEK
jgi:hypothetical protein